MLMLSLYSLIRTIYIYIAPLLVKNSKAFSKIYTKNYFYFTEYSHRWNESQQLWSSAEEHYTTVVNKTQSKAPKNPKQKAPEMPDATGGKWDISAQRAMWSRSVCALRSSAGGSKHTSSWLQQQSPYMCSLLLSCTVRDILSLNCESTAKNEPGICNGFWWWEKGKHMQNVNSSFLSTKFHTFANGFPF